MFDSQNIWGVAVNLMDEVKVKRYKITTESISDISITIDKYCIPMEDFIAYGYVGIEYTREDIQCKEKRDYEIPLCHGDIININGFKMHVLRYDTNIALVYEQSINIASREYIIELGGIKETVEKLQRRLSITGSKTEIVHDGVYLNQISKAENIHCLLNTISLAAIVPRLYIEKTDVKRIISKRAFLNFNRDKRYELDLLSVKDYNIERPAKELYVHKWDYWTPGNLKYIKYDELYSAGFINLSNNLEIECPKVLGGSALSFVTKNHWLKIRGKAEHVNSDVFLNYESLLGTDLTPTDIVAIYTDNDEMHNILVDRAKYTLTQSTDKTFIIDDEMIGAEKNELQV